MNLVTHVMRMAARTVGTAAAEAAVLDTPEARRAASTACYKLAAKGRLHRAQLGPKSVRYFANPEFRDAYVRLVEQERAEAAAAALKVDDGFRPKWPAGTVAVVPAHVVVQVCPAFMPRYAGHDVGEHGSGQRGRVSNDNLELRLGVLR